MIKETDDQGNTKYKYTKCPACGSESRHFEELSAEAIRLGSVRQGYLTPFQHVDRMLVDPLLEVALPVGSEIPGITVATEVCVDCGNVYAPMVIRGKATKKLDTPKLFLPGQN